MLRSLKNLQKNPETEGIDVLAEVKGEKGKAGMIGKAEAGEKIETAEKGEKTGMVVKGEKTEMAGGEKEGKEDVKREVATRIGMVMKIDIAEMVAKVAVGVTSE